MSDVTKIIEAIAQGRACATRDLFPVVYQELRQLAASRLSMEAPGHTLQPTALLHEAYVRLLGSDSGGWENRSHFFAAAAEAMRRILIDHARHKRRLKRGGNAVRQELSEEMAAEESRLEELLAINDSLDQLEQHDPPKANLVKLKFFGGMSLKEAADVLGIPHRTADRHWAYARAWLRKHMAENHQE